MFLVSVFLRYFESPYVKLEQKLRSKKGQCLQFLSLVFLFLDSQLTDVLYLGRHGGSTAPNNLSLTCLWH